MVFWWDLGRRLRGNRLGTDWGLVGGSASLRLEVEGEL